MARFDLSAKPALQSSGLSVGFVAAGEFPQGDFLRAIFPPPAACVRRCAQPLLRICSQKTCVQMRSFEGFYAGDA
jgi:hypothetical protein